MSSPETPAGRKQLAALLVCLTGREAAANVRRPLVKRLRAAGNTVVDTTVLQVDGKHKASVHNPRRVAMGAVTSTVTWGLFGLLTGGVWSLIVSALIGAFWGGYMAYREGHHATDTQLAGLGKQLPADSSALLTFVETGDARTLLAAPTDDDVSVASVAAIADDLTARVFTGSPDAPVEVAPDQVPQDEPGRLSMILLRYPDTSTATKVAARVATSEDAAHAPQVELVIETDHSGRRHVKDYKLGAVAVAKYNVVSWGVLGLVCGAVSGLTGGDGVIGFLEGGLVTGITWGLFGAAAGALYGLWAGRSLSARRLNETRGQQAANTLQPADSSRYATTANAKVKDAIEAFPLVMRWRCLRSHDRRQGTRRTAASRHQ